MSERNDMQKEAIADTILFASQEISDTAFERFVSGEFSQEGLEKIYNMLRQWTNESDELLNILNLRG